MVDSSRPSRVALVDDQRAFAEAVTLALELTDDLRSVCTAANADDGFEAIASSRPDLVVLDYRLQGAASGIDLARRIRSADETEYPGLNATPIVLLTGYPAPVVIREGVKVGVAAVLSKDLPIADIIRVFRRAIAGEPCGTAITEDPFGLTKGETEVLEYLARGMNAAEIARDLCLSLHAIRARIKGTLKKMDVSGQLEAVALATSLGLVVPPREDSRKAT